MWDALDRHEWVAVSFSGGKDSLAVCYMLREAGLLDRVRIYHNDTGDLLPEVREIVEHVKGFAPNFVHMRGNVAEWIAANGLPSDLVPWTQHHVAGGMGHGSGVVSRFDCCFANLMRPLWERIKADGNTLVIRGTRRDDMPRLPFADGEVMDGVELLLPLRDWTADDVFAYLRRVGAPICRVYEQSKQAPECATCSAWWEEGRAAYLGRHHPDLLAAYRARMVAVTAAIAAPLEALRTEMRGLV